MEEDDQWQSDVITAQLLLHPKTTDDFSTPSSFPGYGSDIE